MIDSSVFLNNKNISKNTSYKNDDSSDSSRIHHNTIDQFDLMNTSAHTPGSEMDMNISEFPLASNFHQNNMSDMHSYRYMQQNTQMNTPSAMDNSQNLSSSISKLSMSSGEVDNHSKQQNFTNGNNYTSQVSPLSLYIIKIQNVPSDLSPRECHLLFALMIDSTPRCIEILQDGGEKYIKAVVSDLSAAVTTAIILESKKSLFGPFFPFKSFIQLFDNRTMQQIPFNDPSYSSKNKLNPGYSKDADPAHLKFVDPFYSNYYDRPVSNNAHATMNNTNIWHNQNTMGGSGDMTSNFLRHNFDTPQYGLRFSGMTEYDAYAATNQLQNSRASKNNTNYDTYSPPVSASENQPAAQQQMGSTAENSTLSGGRMDSLGDIPVSQLRKASLSMTTASHGTDPRMNIAAGSVDGSILRLEEYIISSKHLRNMPIIYASIPGITEADLDALARVPAPTNPADQNPPCNTLYVGNLSPDTVESDMSDLFEKEEGFLRLSFRSKPNNNKNNHGPMCFVEFEEIIFAARALAKLYGVEVQSNHKVTEPTPEIPNDSGIKKMVGIRLSFTKNPLGVRNSKPTPHHVPRQNKQHNDHEPVNDYRRNSRASSQSSVLNTNTNGGNKGSRQSNNVTKETMNSNNWRNAFGDHSQSRDSGRHKKKREDSVVSDPRYTFGDNAVVFDRKGEDDVYKQFR